MFLIPDEKPKRKNQNQKLLIENERKLAHFPNLELSNFIECIFGG